MRKLLLLFALFAIFTFKNKAQTVTDYDGNIYHTVTIGTQVWMVENLKTTHYRNGDPIPNVTINRDWFGLSTCAFCWYNNDESTYKNPYGALYNWYAVNDSRNICPSGWHIPSEAEWTTLYTYIGGTSVAGGKLKEAGFTHWVSPNTGATNIIGFTALPGGIRSLAGHFMEIGYLGTLWSSTEYGSNALDQDFFNSSTNINIESFDKRVGISVRCVMDNPTIPTLSQWGLIIFGFILLIIGVVYLIKKRMVLTR